MIDFEGYQRLPITLGGQPAYFDIGFKPFSTTKDQIRSFQNTAAYHILRIAQLIPEQPVDTAQVTGPLPDSEQPTVVMAPLPRDTSPIQKLWRLPEEL